VSEAENAAESGSRDSQSTTIILSLGIKYSMRGLIYDILYTVREA